jgi:GNAT superfamily N-acetyltransferase
MTNESLTVLDHKSETSRKNTQIEQEKRELDIMKSDLNPNPEYETFEHSDVLAKGYRIKVVRDFEDMAKVVAIRASAYFSDEEHLYGKHFDGNDFSATHLIGYVDGEPVGTIRIRYFAEFTRIERLAVRPTHRKSRIAFKLAKAAFAWCRDKGYRIAGGVARSELIPFWTMLGFRLTEGKDPIYIYGLPHYDITLNLDEASKPLSAMTDTLVLLRSEGRWHEAGHHETVNVTKPTGIAAPPPMVRRAKRPADVAARLGDFAESDRSQNARVPVTRSKQDVLDRVAVATPAERSTPAQTR